MKKESDIGIYSQSSMRQKNSQFDDIDLFEMLICLTKQWKVVLLVIVVGIVVSITYSLRLPSIYKYSVDIAPVSKSLILDINSSSLLELSEVELVDVILLHLNSQQSFVRSFEYEDELSRVINVGTEDEQSTAVQTISSGLNVKPIFGDSSRNKDLVPDYVRVSLTHNDTEVAKQLVLAFLERSHKEIAKNLITENEKLKSVRLKVLTDQMNNLRIEANYSRALQIEKLKNDLEEHLETLKYEKQQLLVLEKKDKDFQISRAKEALKIAQSLKIVKPNIIGEFDQSESSDLEKMVVLGGNNVPLFLMGSDYLKALIDTLESRENIGILSKKIFDIDKRIATVNNAAELKALINRNNDDPYIPELSQLRAKIEALNTKTLNLDNQHFFHLAKQPPMSTLVSPSKLTTIMLGTFTSIFVALVIGGLASVVSVRKQFKQNNNYKV